MNPIQKTLKEGIVMGIEYAEHFLEMFPYEQAMGAINDHKMRLKQEIENSEKTSEFIPEETW